MKKYLYGIFVFTACLATIPSSHAAISLEERRQATEELAAIFQKAKYFDFVDSRVHGIPMDAPNSFWNASFWTGVQVSKKNGIVIYTHQSNGSDNIGIHSAPYLEGACYAYRLTHNPRYALLARKLMRGFSAWILSGLRDNNDHTIVLNRSFYPQSFHTFEGGRKLIVNYQASRPGINSDAAEYVHRPNNPIFGDIWVKNNRSIDDIGHIARAISQVQACKDIFDDAAKSDLTQMNALYAAWAKSVESAEFIIPTLNRNGQIEIRKNGIGDYNTYNYFGSDPNCNGKLGLRFLYTSDPSGINCDTGMSGMEKLFYTKLSSDSLEILRAQHISAITLAEGNKRNEIARKLREGLNYRLQTDFNMAKNADSYKNIDIQDIAAEIAHAANIGTPIEDEQIRFLYQRLHRSYSNILAPENYNTLHLFDASVPDGEYRYDAPEQGLYFYTMALLIGSCSSAWNQPEKNSLFDCSLLKAAL